MALFDLHESYEMRDAIKHGNYDFVKEKLDGIKLKNTKKYHNWLKIALKNNQPEIFMLLIEHGAPIDGFEEYESDTLLHLAVEYNDDDDSIIDMLIDHGLSVDAINKHHETPMHVAAKERNMHALELLIDQYIEGNQEYEDMEDDDGLSIFHILCMGQNVSNVLKFLQCTTHIINQPVSPHSQYWPGYTALHFAIAHYRFETIDTLLDSGLQMGDKTSKGLTMLHLVCTIDLADWILRESVPLEGEEDKLDGFLENFCQILEKRDRLFDVILDFFRTDIDVRDNKGDNALMYLIRNNTHPDYFTEVLISKLHMNDDSVLQEITNMVIEKQVQNTQKLLMYYHVDYLMFNWNHNKLNKTIEQFNLVNDSGLTCLHHLALLKHDQRHITKFLLDFGADPNILTNDYKSPLHYAVGNKLLYFTNIILQCQGDKLERMVNLNVQNIAGNIPVHHALESPKNNRINFYVIELIRQGSDISIANEIGVTVFHLLLCQIKKIVNQPYFEWVIRSYADTVHLIYSCDSTIIRGQDTWQRFIHLDLNVKFVAEMWKHFVMLKVCNPSIEYLPEQLLHNLSKALHVNEDSMLSSSEYKRACDVEVKHMKKIYFSKFTCLHDMMTKSINTVALYTDNVMLKQVLESRFLSEVFPLYNQLLKARFIKALERKQLLCKAMESLKKLVGLDMPQNCYFKIFSYLSDTTLRTIIKCQ